MSKIEKENKKTPLRTHTGRGAKRKAPVPLYAGVSGRFVLAGLYPCAHASFCICAFVCASVHSSMLSIVQFFMFIIS